MADDEIEALLRENPQAGGFVQETFRGKFFQTGVHPIIDTIRANIDDLKGFKRNIALFALGKTCISGAGSYGHFASTLRGRGDRRADTPNEFVERFRGNCTRINALIFDNGRENKAFNKDVLEILPEVSLPQAKAGVDLAYFDPPYATEFSTTNYETSYHFVEGLMTYWKGKEILDNDRRNFVSRTKYNRDSITELINGFIDGTAQIGAYLMMSYRDKAYPTAAELKEMFRECCDEVDFRRRSVSYGIARYAGEGTAMTPSQADDAGAMNCVFTEEG